MQHPSHASHLGRTLDGRPSDAAAAQKVTELAQTIPLVSWRRRRMSSLWSLRECLAYASFYSNGSSALAGIFVVRGHGSGLCAFPMPDSLARGQALLPWR